MNTMILSQGFLIVVLRHVCVLTTLLFIGSRWEWLRQGLDSEKKGVVLNRLVWIVLFSLGAIVDDNTGWVFNVDSGEVILRPLGQPLQPRQAIIDLRDLTACVAGLAGGVHIGPAVGLIAGIGRILVGGEFGLPAGIATMVIGCLSAWLHHRLPWIRFAPGSAFLLGVVITAVQRLIILLIFVFVQQRQLADLIPLFRVVTWPKLVTNACGCAIFAWIMQVVETDKKTAEYQRNLSERTRELAQHMVTSYLGQIQPHFLSNALNNLRPVVFEDPNRADDYITKLGRFFRDTHTYAAARVIPLHEELRHVVSYIEFQQQRFADRIHLTIDIDQRLGAAMVPPHTLLTLVENAFNHALQGQRVLELTLRASDKDNRLLISVEDNGPGYPPELIQKLGNNKVQSTTAHGTGTALFRLKQVLLLIYPGGTQIDFGRSESGGARAQLLLPMESDS